MKSLSKIPLYVGLSVLVISILFSAVRLKEKNSVANLQSRAGLSGASLSLQFSAPDLVSVSVTSEKEVAGIDAIITFQKDAVTILPSTLSGSSPFVTSGGEVNKEAGTFSFSAFAKENVTAGVIATFRLQAKDTHDVATQLQIAQGEGKSAVIAKDTGGNILSQVTGVNFTLSGKKGE